MIRYLPIVMLAFGLLLLSASFASAKTPGELIAKQNDFCAAPAQADTGFTVPAKLGRCWKQMGLGVLVPGCQVHAQLVRIAEPPIPDTDRSWPAPMDLMADDGPPPLLDIPPPRA